MCPCVPTYNYISSTHSVTLVDVPYMYYICHLPIIPTSFLFDYELAFFMAIALQPQKHMYPFKSTQESFSYSIVIQQDFPLAYIIHSGV